MPIVGRNGKLNKCFNARLQPWIAGLGASSNCVNNLLEQNTTRRLTGNSKSQTKIVPPVKTCSSWPHKEIQFMCNRDIVNMINGYTKHGEKKPLLVTLKSALTEGCVYGPIMVPLYESLWVVWFVEVENNKVVRYLYYRRNSLISISIPFQQMKPPEAPISPVHCLHFKLPSLRNGRRTVWIIHIAEIWYPLDKKVDLGLHCAPEFGLSQSYKEWQMKHQINICSSLLHTHKKKNDIPFILKSVTRIKNQSNHKHILWDARKALNITCAKNAALLQGRGQNTEMEYVETDERKINRGEVHSVVFYPCLADAITQQSPPWSILVTLPWKIMRKGRVRVERTASVCDTGLFSA